MPALHPPKGFKIYCKLDKKTNFDLAVMETLDHISNQTLLFCFYCLFIFHTRENAEITEHFSTGQYMTDPSSSWVTRVWLSLFVQMSTNE